MPGLRQVLTRARLEGLETIRQSPAAEGLPGWLSGKEPVCQCRRGKRRRFHPWVGKVPWRRKWNPLQVFLPEKYHGQRSRAGTVHGAVNSRPQLSVHTVAEAPVLEAQALVFGLCSHLCLNCRVLAVLCKKQLSKMVIN